MINFKLNNQLIHYFFKSSFIISILFFSLSNKAQTDNDKMICNSSSFGNEVLEYECYYKYGRILSSTLIKRVESTVSQISDEMHDAIIIEELNGKIFIKVKDPVNHKVLFQSVKKALVFHDDYSEPSTIPRIKLVISTYKIKSKEAKEFALNITNLGYDLGGALLQYTAPTLSGGAINFNSHSVDFTSDFQIMRDKNHFELKDDLTISVINGQESNSLSNSSQIDIAVNQFNSSSVKSGLNLAFSQALITKPMSSNKPTGVIFNDFSLSYSDRNDINNDLQNVFVLPNTLISKTSQLQLTFNVPVALIVQNKKQSSTKKQRGFPQFSSNRSEEFDDILLVINTSLIDPNDLNNNSALAKPYKKNTSSTGLNKQEKISNKEYLDIFQNLEFSTEPNSVLKKSDYILTIGLKNDVLQKYINNNSSDIWYKINFNKKYIDKESRFIRDWQRIPINSLAAGLLNFKFETKKIEWEKNQTHDLIIELAMENISDQENRGEYLGQVKLNINFDSTHKINIRMSDY